MRSKRSFAGNALILSSLVGSTAVYPQQIPNDAIHLPQKIGPSKSGPARVDTVSVAGKVTFNGLPSGEPTPAAYVAVFMYGRLVGRRQVTANGSYNLNDVPREGSTIVVEIENVEVASSQIIPSPAEVVYRDFSIQWNQVPKKYRSPAAVISVKDIYVRSPDAQKSFESAVGKLNGRNPENAIVPLILLVKADPMDFEAFVELGSAYLMVGRNSDAFDAFENALKVRPQYLRAKLGLGRVLVVQQNYDKAIVVLAEVVTNDPSSADGHHFLGESYLLTKKGSKAVPHLNEALRLAPTRKAEIHLQLAALYNGAGLKARAAEEYEKFLEKIPNHEKRRDFQRYIQENQSAEKKKG